MSDDAASPPSDDANFYSETGMRAHLRRLFPAQTYAVLFNVADSTGSVSRRVDALVQSLWPSRGLGLMGVEIKVSRADWLRELKDGGKADVIARFCDYWYVAAGDAAIVQGAELPEGWGLIAPVRGVLKIAQPARKLDAQPWTPRFRAAVLRAAQDASGNDAAVLAAKSDGYKAGLEHGKGHYRARAEQAESELAKFRESIDELDRLTGGRWRYDVPGVAAALELRRRLPSGYARSAIEQAARNLEASAATIREALAASDAARAAVESAGGKEPDDG